jgi:hypothetical protein
MLEMVVDGQNSRLLAIITTHVILTISKGYLDLGGNIGGEGNWNDFVISISVI